MLKETSSIKAQARFEVILKELAWQESLQPSSDKNEEPAKAKDILKETRNNFTKLKLQNEGWGILAPGLKETYGKARKDMKRAIKNRDDKYLHNWRRVSKYLWYQLQFIEQIRSNGIDKIIKRLRQLGQKLGSYHDYVMLVDRLNANPEIFGGNEIVDPVTEVLNVRKEKLKKAYPSR
ncbi:MAG: CHAD domain-containing protein [Acidobacteriota bacterium]